MFDTLCIECPECKSLYRTGEVGIVEKFGTFRFKCLDCDREVKNHIIAESEPIIRSAKRREMLLKCKNAREMRRFYSIMGVPKYARKSALHHGKTTAYCGDVDMFYCEFDANENPHRDGCQSQCPDDCHWAKDCPWRYETLEEAKGCWIEFGKMYGDMTEQEVEELIKRLEK